MKVLFLSIGLLISFNYSFSYEIDIINDSVTELRIGSENFNVKKISRNAKYVLIEIVIQEEGYRYIVYDRYLNEIVFDKFVQKTKDEIDGNGEPILVSKPLIEENFEHVLFGESDSFMYLINGYLDDFSKPYTRTYFIKNYSLSNDSSTGFQIEIPYWDSQDMISTFQITPDGDYFYYMYKDPMFGYHMSFFETQKGKYSHTIQFYVPFKLIDYTSDNILYLLFIDDKNSEAYIHGYKMHDFNSFIFTLIKRIDLDFYHVDIEYYDSKIPYIKNDKFYYPFLGLINIYDYESEKLLFNFNIVSGRTFFDFYQPNFTESYIQITDGSDLKIHKLFPYEITFHVSDYLEISTIQSVMSHNELYLFISDFNIYFIDMNKPELANINNWLEY